MKWSRHTDDEVGEWEALYVFGLRIQEIASAYEVSWSVVKYRLTKRRIALRPKLIETMSRSEYERQYRSKNREHINAYKRRRRKENPEQAKSEYARYYRNNQEKNRARSKDARNSLSTHYVLKSLSVVLKKPVNLSTGIPPELIEAKRTQLALFRAYQGARKCLQ